MTSAGSLFTSCIEQVEPLGIQDLRYAKAEYIRALKDLRAADAEYRRAEAAVQLAIARYEDALTAGVNADTEYQKLLNEYQALVNQDYAGEVAYNEAERLAKLDSLQKAMEVRELNHKRALAEAEKDMRIAQEDLRVTIRNISLACGDLTANEKVAIYEAAAVYYYLLEQVIVQDSVVNAAQIELAKAEEYALRFSDTAWSREQLALVDVYEQIQEEIEAEQAKIAFWQEKYENLPDTAAAIAQWKAYMEAFDDEINAINVEKAKNIADSVAMVALLKESIRDFDVAVAEWIQKNWTKSGTTYKEPATSAGAKPDSATYTSGYADSLEIVMLKPEDPKAAAAWAKFVYLLDSYEHQVFPFSNVTPKDSVITVNATEDTVTVVIRQDMSEFILGAAGNKEDSQKYEYLDEDENKHTLKANYGLLGVYDILARDKVIGESSAKTPEQIATAKENMEKAEAKWLKDSSILSKGIANFLPFKEGEQNLKDQIATNGVGSKKMVNAVKNLKAAIAASYTAFDSFDGNDSTKLFDAMIEFAKAREEYLDFETSVEEIDPQDPTKRDSSIFYYSKGKSGAEKPIFASAKFSELTSANLDAAEYEYITVDPGDKFYVDTISAPKSKSDSIVNAYANIMSQLGSELVSMFDFTNDTIVAPAIGTDALKTAMYGKYRIDSWSDPKEIQKYNTETSAWESYVPEDLLDAEENFVDSINAYIAVYRAYWGYTTTDIPDVTSSTTVVADYIKALKDNKNVSTKRTALLNYIFNASTGAGICPTNGYYSPSIYSRATFRPYADEAPIVYFNGTNIIPTAALAAVMKSVDAKAKDHAEGWLKDQDVEDATAIFKDGKTDFYDYMYKAFTYYSYVNTKPSENLAKIRAEIKKVEDALAADKAQAGVFDEDSYKAAVASWEKKKAKADAYYAAKKEFAGIKSIDSDGNVTWYPIFANPLGASTVVEGQTAYLKIVGVEALFAKNILGNYSGWNSNLKAGQRELAIELFGEEPWEQFNEWKLANAQYDAQINELNKLKLKAEDVYMAKAKLEGYRDAGTSGATAADIEALYKAYKDAYEALQNKIVVFDEYGNVDLDNNTGEINKAYNKIEALAHKAATYKSDKPDYDHEINFLQHELEKEQNRLKTYKDALKLAKENYDRIREYLLSQDGVSYVIPVSTADIDDAIMNIEYLLRSLGHTFADVYTEVGDKIGI